MVLLFLTHYLSDKNIFCLERFKKHKIFQQGFDVVSFVKFTTVKKQITLGIRRQIPAMCLARRQEKHRTRLDFIPIEINFVHTGSSGKQKNCIKIVFMM